jgi:hypothetical protein
MAQAKQDCGVKGCMNPQVPMAFGGKICRSATSGGLSSEKFKKIES